MASSSSSPIAQIPQDWWPKEVADLVRVGRHHDGGYVVPKCAILSAKYLISVGVNDDWSFEKAALGLNASLCLVGVDATTTPWYVIRRGIRFRLEYAAALLTRHADKLRYLAPRMPSVLDYWRFWGAHTLVHKMLAGRDSEGAIRLQSLMRETQADSEEATVFLKVDIEGAEYQLLQDIVSVSPRLTGLAMELHDLPGHIEQVQGFFESLRANFLLVHLHANTYEGVDPQTALPKVLEATWVNRQLVSGQEVDAPALPRPVLDHPSKYSHQEIRIFRRLDA